MRYLQYFKGFSNYGVNCSDPVVRWATFGSRFQGDSEVQMCKVLNELRAKKPTLPDCEDRISIRSSGYIYSNVYTVYMGDPEDRGSLKPGCCYCRKHAGKHFYVLQFLSADQFKAFFGEAVLPDQFEKYLNQSSEHYYGNSILEDVDPLLMIHNPWWVDSISRYDGDIVRGYNHTPAFYIRFDLCGICARKLRAEDATVSPFKQGEVTNVHGPDA